MKKESDIIECRLEKIIWSNDSGFIIGAFVDQHSNRLSGMGEMINPQEGMHYILTGQTENHYKYGEQLKFHAYETVKPVDTNSIFKYIVRVCKFVGGTVGNDIVTKYGEKTLEIMKNDPEKLAREIKGITADRAIEIQESLKENEKTEKIMIELGALLNVPGMLKSLSGKLIKRFKSNAAEIIKSNPYSLTDFRGVSFFLADSVALHIGFDLDSLERKIAAARHIMIENQQDGNSWIPRNLLALRINELIHVAQSSAGIDELVKDDLAIEENGFFAFSSAAYDEMLIAEKIIQMVNC